jgi:hypothetical protein
MAEIQRPMSHRQLIFVGIFCPHKGVWVAVGIVDKAVDGFFKFLEGTEDAPRREHVALKQLVIREFRYCAILEQSSLGTVETTFT